MALEDRFDLKAVQTKLIIPASCGLLSGACVKIFVVDLFVTAFNDTPMTPISVLNDTSLAFYFKIKTFIGKFHFFFFH